MNLIRDKEIVQAKEEGDTTTNPNNNLLISRYNTTTTKEAAAAAAAVPSSSTTSSRQWSGFKNPRIVRVSRTFGGKDRHSKVCTIRGLRDRRIRLSVPTAIQLYDLQDRLGLSQPSKVIDWLLDATKHDIDKLPPLQIPPGSFGFYPHHHAMLGGGSDAANHHHHLALESSFAPFLDANLTLMNDGAVASNSVYSNSAPHHHAVVKEAAAGININHDIDEDEEDEEDDQMSLEAKLEKIKWNINRSNEEDQEHHHHHQQFHGGGDNSTAGCQNDDSNNAGTQQQQHQQAFAQNFFPITTLNNSSFFNPGGNSHGGGNGGGGLLSNPMPYGYYPWDPSNLSLSQFGNLNQLPNPQADHHQEPSSGSQLFFQLPQQTMNNASSSVFPHHSYMSNQHVDDQNDMRQQINRFHLSPSFHQSQGNDDHGGQGNKNDDG